eukprot:Phypoly_transcript_03028.p1 GENE.Phypoly_transcript_03028~~Phypoly_transcript_03028.p1  ORF type:complete len:736 (+),score=120.46 Phypoly_transcript_03028:316-2523(+)
MLSFTRVSIVAFCFFCFVSGSSTDTNISGFCQNYEYSVSSSVYCAPFVSSQIFVPNNTNLTEINSKLLNDSAFNLVIKTQSIIPLDCYKSTMSLVCQSYFPACSPPSAPTYPCLSSCQAAAKSCGTSWTIVGKSFPLNCSGEIWPTQNCTATIYDGGLSNHSAIPAVTTCPSVYNLVRNPSETVAPCAVRCPNPSYTRAEYAHVAKVALGFGILSVLLMCFLIASYSIDFNKRKFPARLQPYLFISIIGFTIGPLMSGLDPMDRTMCVDPTTYSTQENNSVCVAQTVFLMYFAFTSHLWTLVISALTFYTIVFEVRPSHFAPYEKYIHCLVWGIPMIFVIITLGTNNVNFGISSRIYCFVKLDLQHAVTFDYYVFYIPLVVLIILTAVLFSASLYKLIMYQRANRKEGRLTKTMIIAQRRILVVTAILIIIFGASYGYRFSATRDVIVDSVIAQDKWIACKLRSELFGLPYPPTCDSDINPFRKSMASMTFQNTFLPFIGIIVFVSFGSEPRIYRHWVALARCVKERDFSKLRGYVLHGYSSDQTPTPPPINLSLRQSRSIKPRSLSSALTPTTDSLSLNPSLYPSSSSEFISPPSSAAVSVDSPDPPVPQPLVHIASSAPLISHLATSPVLHTPPPSPPSTSLSPSPFLGPSSPLASSPPQQPLLDSPASSPSSSPVTSPPTSPQIASSPATHPPLATSHPPLSTSHASPSLSSLSPPPLPSLDPSTPPPFPYL